MAKLRNSQGALDVKKSQQNGNLTSTKSIRKLAAAQFGGKSLERLKADMSKDMSRKDLQTKDSLAHQKLKNQQQMGTAALYNTNGSLKKDIEMQAEMNKNKE